MICQGRDILALMAHRHFEGQPTRPDIVRFVRMLSRKPRSAPSPPVSLPKRGKWLLKILAREHRFVFGVYRRKMKAIAYLGEIDQLFWVPSTSRKWNTITAIAKALDNEQPRWT